MNSNKVIKQIHLAAVRKTAENIALTGNKQKAAAVGNAFVRYGQLWTNGLANDGRIDEREVAAIAAEFDALVDAHIPAVDSVAVGFAYDGVSIFGLGWKGVKHYLNKWFRLGL